MRGDGREVLTRGFRNRTGPGDLGVRPDSGVVGLGLRAPLAGSGESERADKLRGI